MDEFYELMATDPPRLVVQYGHTPDGSECFEWGAVGSIPVLTIIGYVERVCVELVTDIPIPECDVPNNPPSLVIAMDPRDGKMVHYKHSSIPADALVGMLAVIKATLIQGRVAQHMAAQHMAAGIIGPDGRPVNRH